MLPLFAREWRLGGNQLSTTVECQAFDKKPHGPGATAPMPVSCPSLSQWLLLSEPLLLEEPELEDDPDEEVESDDDPDDDDSLPELLLVEAERAGSLLRCLSLASDAAPLPCRPQNLYMQASK